MRVTGREARPTRPVALAYPTAGYKCRGSSHSPPSATPQPVALQGAWGWRRAPGGGGWSCGPGPHRHCSQGSRGRWTGSRPTALLAGTGHSSLPRPGPAPRRTPPLAVPGLWETENRPQRGQGALEGSRGAGRGGDQSRPEKGACPSCSLSLSPLSSGLRTPGNKPRSSPATGCPNAGSGSARQGSLGPPGPRPLSLVPTPCSDLSLLPSSPQVRAHPGPAL